MTPEQLKEKIEELEGKAADLKAKLETPGEADKPEELAKDLKAIKDSIETLESDKAKAEKEAEFKALREQVETLTGALDETRKPMKEFSFKGAGVPTPKRTDGGLYGEGAENSFYNDVRLARKQNDQKAFERLEEAKKAAIEESHEGKAMQEAVDTQGGYLVVPEISNELIRLREQESVLRPLFASQPISVDELRIAAITNGLAVAWQAELTQKIINEFKFAEISAHVFTAAGLAVASNQLLADSRFSIDQLINQDLAKRFVALEEQAFLNGSGEGQPRGIRNTKGVQSIAYKEAVPTIPALLDIITNAITEIYSNYFGAPNAIVMHPRTWGRIVKAHETTSPSTYLIGAGSTAFGRRGNDPLPGYNGGSTPRGELFGLPVYTTANVPTTLGTTENESAIFVGDFSQGLVLDRQGVVTDQSEHVFFTSNQTVFRAEERIGFTAARYPKAFAVIEGSGLAAG